MSACADECHTLLQTGIDGGTKALQEAASSDDAIPQGLLAPNRLLCKHTSAQQQFFVQISLAVCVQQSSIRGDRAGLTPYRGPCTARRRRSPRTHPAGGAGARSAANAEIFAIAHVVSRCGAAGSDAAEEKAR